MDRVSCPHCKNEPTKVTITGIKGISKGYGCCGAYFSSSELWNKYTEEVVLIKPEPKRKKETITILTNPRLSNAATKVLNYWNGKDLRKHANLQANVAVRGAKCVDALIRGDFLDMDFGQPIKAKDIIKAIDIFEMMANDPEVPPILKHKKAALKKMSLEDFFYDERANRSYFREIVEAGFEIKTKATPISTTVFDKIIKKATILSGKKLSASELNKLAVFSNHVMRFYESNKKKMEGSAAGLAKIILGKVSEGKQYLPFSLLISDEMRDSIIERTAIQEGFLLKARSSKDEVSYSSSKRSRTTTEF